MPPQGCVPADSLKQFMAVASCLSEFTHVVDVLLYGQLSLIVIVYLSRAKQQCRGRREKKTFPYIGGPFASLPVYLCSRLKI